MLDWLSTVNWEAVGITASAIIAASSALLHVIAPLTKWTGDDKAAKVLAWILAALTKLSLNKQLPPPTTEE